MYAVLCTCSRSEKYQLNLSAGSDGDLLLTSLSREKDFAQDNSETELSTNVSHTSANPSSSHDPLTTPSSNGIATPSSLSGSSPKGQRKVLNSNDNCSTNTDSNASNNDSESGNETKVNSKGTVEDGEVASEEELQENYR